ETKKHYEAKLPENCQCCRTSSPTLCMTALAAVLFILDTISPIQFVDTNIRLLQGKLLQTDTLKADIGFRCKHNWTKGLPNFRFETTISQPNTKPNLLIFHKSNPMEFSNPCRTLCLL